jgi:hypothetical protein
MRDNPFLTGYRRVRYNIVMQPRALHFPSPLAAGNRPLNRWDILAALLVGAGSLGIYGRTLAPGILYGDSAEFQTLAATLGVAHPSGYALYLLLAKVFTWLPLHNLAWRVNLLSAVMGALALVGMYWMIRLLRGSRSGAILGVVIVGISRTFWSQTVIAEVYTLAAATVLAALLLLFAWQNDPPRRLRWLFLSTFLVGLSLHITVVVMAPAMVLFVCWTLVASHQPARQWGRTLGVGLAGALAGAAVFLLATLALVWHNPPTSYVQVTLIPSHSAWALDVADLDTPFEQLTATVLGAQWQHSLFSGSIAFILAELKHYLKWMLNYDLTIWVFPLALLGWVVILLRRRAWGVFLALYGATLLFLIMNYMGPGKYVFYMSTYLLIGIAAGVGVSWLLSFGQTALEAQPPWLFRTVQALGIALLAWALLSPFWVERWQALQAGAATFVTNNDDTYPVHDLLEPRTLAEQRLEQVESDAILLMDWKMLYPTYFIAHVENRRPGVRILEDIPGEHEGTLAESLVQEITQALQRGQPVYSDRPYPKLEATFNFTALAGINLVRVELVAGADH